MTEARIYNADPPPRMIIRGFHDEPDLVARLAALVPTSVHVRSLREVNQAEWDVLVTDTQIDEDVPGIWSHERLYLREGLYAVVRPSTAGWATIDGDERWSGRIAQDVNHIRRELRRIADIPARVQPLVEQLEPILRARASHEYFYTGPRRMSGPSAPGASPVVKLPPPALQPFAETADGKVLAGRYQRSDDAEAWLLPSDVPDLVPWVSAALAEWHARDPERFPGSPEWSRQPDWATTAERELLDALAAVEAERQETLARLDEERRTLDERLSAARAAADSYERALLTEQGDALVQAVLRALADLGFTVIDADKELDVREKLEDLHVRDPDDPDWIALAEVKGYTKGAQTGALTQFLRFDRRFQERTGRPPGALWYVVNQFKDRDPTNRQAVLQGNEVDVETFASVGGLVVDTVQLFRLLEAVRSGRLGREEARSALRSASGRFTAP